MLAHGADMPIFGLFRAASPSICSDAEQSTTRERETERAFASV
jgi:hypothetical protein